MSQKIYKLALVRGYTEAYYQLSDEEKAKLWERVSEVVGAAGGKRITPYYNSRWSNDQYMLFFTMEYANIDAAMDDTSAVEEIELFRYMISETILGVAGDDTMP